MYRVINLTAAWKRLGAMKVCASTRSKLAAIAEMEFAYLLTG